MLVLQALAVLVVAVFVIRYWFAYASNFRLSRVVVAAAVTAAWAFAAHVFCDVDLTLSVVLGLGIVIALVHDAANPEDEPVNIIKALFYSDGYRWPDTTLTSATISWYLLHLEASCPEVSYGVGVVIAIVILNHGFCLWKRHHTISQKDWCPDWRTYIS